MIIKVQLVLFIFLIAIAISVTHSTNTGQDNKPWRKILDPANSHVLKVGRTAVRLESQATNTKLLFRKVVRGETQVVDDGMNYRMIVQASNPSDDTTDNYETLIHEKHLKELKHVYYRKLSPRLK